MPMDFASYLSSLNAGGKRMQGSSGGGVTATKGKRGKPVRPSPQAKPPKNPYVPPRRPPGQPRPKPDAQGSGAAPQPQAPAWWQRDPANITELLRQLSVNAGQMGMPGGYVGAVQKPAFGTGGQPMIPQDMPTYGQAPNMGEATFFQQGVNGGMAPIAAMSPLGVPAGWNPLGQPSAQKPSAQKPSAQKPSRPNRPSNQRNKNKGIDGFGVVDGRIGIIGPR